MSDNILSAILTFSLLAGGTAAIGTEMFNTRTPQRTASVLTLEPVTVVAHRQVALEVVVLPAVTVTGRRSAATLLASETQASEPRRIQ